MMPFTRLNSSSTPYLPARLGWLAGLLLALALLAGLLSPAAQADGAIQPGPYRAEDTPPGLSPADWGQITTLLAQAGVPAALPAQQAYLKASNPDGSDQFGYAVAVSGDTVVVGAYQEDSAAGGVNPPGGQANNSAAEAGAAYVFIRSGSSWSQQAYLKASNPDGSDQFGYSVAVSGDTIVVGALAEDSAAGGVNGDQADNSAAEAGAAYVFVRSGGDWSQQAYLKASNPDGGQGGGDVFGFSVAISGDTIVVGANGEDSNATGVNGDQADNSVLGAGAAYVFVRSGSSWSQQAYFKASNPDVDDQFGLSVAISGDTVVVGAEGEDSAASGVTPPDGQADNSANSAGAAYVFVRSGTNWSHQSYLKASNTGVGDRFGFSVAVSGDTIVVGAKGESSAASGVNPPDGQDDNSAFNTGAAYVFVRSSDGSSWSQQAYLKASNADGSDEFGHSVAVSGDTIVVGARDESSAARGVNPSGGQANNAAFGAGAVYVFVRSGSSWSQQSYLKASNAEANDRFGWSAAVSGDTVVVGAVFEDSNANGGQADNSAFDAGAAYTFFMPPVGEMAVLGNGLEIASGNTAPSLADQTDFGSVPLGGPPITHTFTLSNSGLGVLNLTTTPPVSLTGPAAGDFSVVVQPATPVLSQTTTTFQIRFTPSLTGTRPAAVTIPNDDLDENPYTFAIQGTGTEPGTGGPNQSLYLPLIFKP